MPAYRDRRTNAWRYRKRVRLPSGQRIRIEGTPAINTKQAAEAAERAHIERALRGERPPEPKKEVPRFEEFADRFLDLCRSTNKPSEVQSKESVLRVHLSPYFKGRRLDKIGYADAQDYAAAKLKSGLAPKTVLNHLIVLRRLLGVAKKRGEIPAVPEIEWLKVPQPEFDFLDFEEAERLVAAADESWRPMIVVALKTGMRLGELFALRWEDVDLVKGVLHVRRSATRGFVTTPKSGKGRDIPLGDEALAALKSQRHLRGPLVFCAAGGEMFKKNECKHPLWRACKRAGLRRIGWHALRHTFASHLVMRGAALKAIQELLGHAAITTTMRYAHLSPDVPRQVVRLLDSAPPAGRQVGDSSKIVPNLS